MLGAKIITNRIIKNEKRSDFAHSSGYAKAQNHQSFGAASAEDFATRKTLDSQRKYVQKYKNSRIMNNYYGAQRARTVEAQVGREATKATSGLSKPVFRTQVSSGPSGFRGR